MLKQLRIPIKDAVLISFDVESTGVQPLSDRILQLALVYMKSNRQGIEIIKEYQSLINPTIPIPAESTNVHHITNEMVANQYTFAQLSKRLVQHFKGLNSPTPAFPAENQTFVLCGYNAFNFDLPIVNQEFERCGYMNVIDGSVPLLDPCIFVRYYYRHYKNNLTEICKYFDIQLLKAHDACEDAKATAELLFKLIDAKIIPAQLQQALDSQKRLKAELDAEYEKYGYWLYKDRSQGILKIGAGAHQGMPLDIVDVDYLAFMLKKVTDFTTETKICFENEVMKRKKST